MTLDYITIGILVISVGVIIIIVSRKFPTIASINTESLQKHKQDRVKKDIIEDRLKRKLTAMKLRGVIRKNNGEIQKKTGSMVKSFYQTLKNLEQKYRTKIREIEPQDKKEQKKSTEILIQEAKTLFEQEKLKEAEGKYIEAISIDSKCSEAYEGLADTYMELKDFEHAKEIYRYLLKMNGCNDATYQHLGAIAAEEGNFKEAEQDYLKSISLNEEVAGYHVDLGEVYLAMDDKEKALDCFEEAVKLEPNNPRNLDHLITTSIALKKKEKAQEYFKKLQEANPENEKLKEFKQHIKEL